jgi:hypothetical protein
MAPSCADSSWLRSLACTPTSSALSLLATMTRCTSWMTSGWRSGQLREDVTLEVHVVETQHHDLDRPELLPLSFGHRHSTSKGADLGMPAELPSDAGPIMIPW